MLLLTSNIEFYLIYISPVKKVDRLSKIKVKAISKHLLNIDYYTLLKSETTAHFVQSWYATICLLSHTFAILPPMHTLWKICFELVHDSRVR